MNPHAASHTVDVNPTCYVAQLCAIVGRRNFSFLNLCQPQSLNHWLFQCHYITRDHMFSSAILDGRCAELTLTSVVTWRNALTRPPSGDATRYQSACPKRRSPESLLTQGLCPVLSYLRSVRRLSVVSLPIRAGLSHLVAYIPHPSGPICIPAEPALYTK